MEISATLDCGGKHARVHMKLPLSFSEQSALQNRDIFRYPGHLDLDIWTNRNNLVKYWANSKKLFDFSKKCALALESDFTESTMQVACVYNVNLYKTAIIL